jgi:alanine racemase
VRSELPAVRIFVLDGIDEDDIVSAVANRLIPVVNDEAAFETWRRRPEHPIALHVDTGMNRLGLAPDVLERLDLSFRNVVLLMTHLPCSDEPSHASNAVQRAAFARVARQLPNVAISISNSSGVLDRGGESGEICRPGIALYGGNPFVERKRALGTVATFDAPVLQVRRVEAGQTIGYGATFVAPSARLIAVVGAGYADGVPRLLSNRGSVGFGARRLPIVGRVSMDLTCVDATAAPEIRVGDRIAFFGEAVSVDEVAAWAETISYEILTGIGPRVARCYV